MKRQHSSAPLSRTSIHDRIQELRRKETVDWPANLRLAVEIIEYDCLPSYSAREVVLRCWRSAHNCAVAMDSNGFAESQIRARTELHKAATRIRNCAKRVKAPIRDQLDQAVKVFQSDGIDGESIAGFVAAVIEIATSYPDDDDAQRILAALGGLKLDSGFVIRPTKFLNDYEAMHARDRSHLHTNLEERVAGSEKLTALMIFDCIATSTGTGYWEAGSQNDAPITAYLREAAAICRNQFGIQPGRTYETDGPDINNQKYKSRFHRCIELILLDRLDPWSRSFEPSAEDIKRTQAIEKKLDREEREALIPLRHKDLISDYQIRKALKPISKS